MTCNFVLPRRNIINIKTDKGPVFSEIVILYFPVVIRNYLISNE